MTLKIMLKFVPPVKGKLRKTTSWVGGRVGMEMRSARDGIGKGRIHREKENDDDLVSSEVSLLSHSATRVWGLFSHTGVTS